MSYPSRRAGYVSCVRASSAGYGPLADVRSGARAVCPGLVLTRSGPRRAPSGEWRPAGRASGPAPVGGPVRRRAPVRPRPGPSGCVRPRPGPDLPSGAPSGTGLVASMLASARRRAPSGAKFPRPEVSVGRPVRRRRPDRTSGRGPSQAGEAMLSGQRGSKAERARAFSGVRLLCVRYGGPPPVNPSVPAVCASATLGSAQGGGALKIAAARNPSQARKKRPA